MVAIFFGLRYDVGTDYLGYAYIFNNIDLDIYRWRFEPGFTLFASALQALSLEPWVGFLSFSIATIFLVWRGIGLWSDNPPLSIVVLFGLSFLFFFSNGVRQGLAVVVCVMALPYIIDKDIRRFVGVVLIACMFHYTALVFLVAYPVATRRMSSTIAVAVLLGTAVLGLLGIDGTIDALISRTVGYLPSAISDRYSGIFGRIEDQLFDKRGIGAGFRLIFLNGTAIFAVLLQRKNSAFDSALVNISILGQCVFNLFAGLSGPFRFWYYFGIFLIFLIPWIVSRIKGAGSRALVYAGFVSILSSFYLRALMTNHHNIIPYEFYFSYIS
nr:EpsG family protein [Lysobacter antarcticus]